MTEPIYGAACENGFQFFARRVCAGGLYRRVCGDGRICHCADRYRWRVWRSTITSGCEEAWFAGAYGAEVTAQDGSRYTLLAESRKGYQNLCRLITRMKLRGEKRVEKKGGAALPEEFANFPKGLICLTGGEEGALARSLKNNTAHETLEEMVRTFGRGNVTWNCSVTSNARKRRAIRRRLRGRGVCNCRWLPPMAHVTRRNRRGRCWMSLPACTTRPR